MQISRNEMKRIASLSRKKGRDENGLFVVEGEKMVSEAMASGFEVVSVYRRDEIGEEAMARLTSLSSPSPDFRNLLQWKPAVLTDENGVAEITFAASDVNTEFVGLVEAVNGTSSVGAQTFVFRVIKQ